MQIRAVYTPHHPVCNFVIETDNETDYILLRSFCAIKDHRLSILSWGGPTDHSRMSMCIGLRPESDFKEHTTTKD